MKPKELIKILKEDGWYEVRQRGSHKQFRHPVKKGLVTIPFHNKDLDIKTLNSILKQAGLK
ncbi:type II toxin-antitoxin system HicA family toxin [Anaerocellum diazotrophicum]|uniref:Toxin HicA n=1 Tax=Caldicellulosiruptor diazotrophicus TaxID=2806205 RepID=A0ABN6E8Z6_9FIRM|nr:type II toxin-antitoxin system HicA family toxin [Caldicellulosiruptor diazotrophicus]BCS80614.1 toxin HicA [Caldicellulosiruptor diazotrophicus]